METVLSLEKSSIPQFHKPPYPPLKNYSLLNVYTFSSAEFGSLTTSQLMEKVRGLQNLAFQLGLDEGMSLGCIIYSKCPRFH